MRPLVARNAWQGEVAAARETARPAPVPAAPASPAPMHLLEAALRIHESPDADQALAALAGAVRGPVELRLAAWVDAEGAARALWPAGGALPPGLPAGAGEEPRLCTVDGGAARALLLPVRADELPAGTLVLVGGPRDFGEGAGPWLRVGAAFAGAAARAEALRQTVAERDLLRQRAEESEALHVLGLAANRTLDPDEVLSLVARFTRTLLGAHYVTVSTVEEGHIRAVASVGLRGGAPGADDPFAGRVAAARKPLVLGVEGDPVADHPFHAAEAMQAGLGVPLSLFGETVGALVVGYRRPTPLAPRDTRLALTLAGHAAVAISNARLHRALADRSRELEGALGELRWSSDAKERFFASMSHELRTPLNAILGYHSLLLDGIAGPLPETARSFVSRAQRATDDLLLLVNDVLDLSKLAAGKMELLAVPVSPLAVVEEALSTVEPLARRKGLRLEVSGAGAPAVVSTDGDRVRQILLNLLSNAVKFTDHGEVRVTVAPLGAGVEFRVTDTGPGIHPEHHERIFQEFEQIAGATARGGTGLGLPISRKLARLLGGELQVRSAPGMGATFVLRLPGHDGAEGGP